MHMVVFTVHLLICVMRRRVKNGSAFLLLAPRGLGLSWSGGFCVVCSPKESFTRKSHGHLSCKIGNPRRRQGATRPRRNMLEGCSTSFHPATRLTFKRPRRQRAERSTRATSWAPKLDNAPGTLPATFPPILPRKLERNRKLRLTEAQPSPVL